MTGLPLYSFTYILCSGNWVLKHASWSTTTWLSSAWFLGKLFFFSFYLKKNLASPYVHDILLLRGKKIVTSERYTSVSMSNSSKIQNIIWKNSDIGTWELLIDLCYCNILQPIGWDGIVCAKLSPLWCKYIGWAQDSNDMSLLNIAGC